MKIMLHYSETYSSKKLHQSPYRKIFKVNLNFWHDLLIMDFFDIQVCYATLFHTKLSPLTSTPNM
jgi:hypothetical protein